MPAKGTVTIQLNRVQAETLVHWLRDDDRFARELRGILSKAIDRKRPTLELNLQISRKLAQWFASFTRPNGWWEFDGALFPGQQAPEAIKEIAAVFMKAVSRRRGRKRYGLTGNEEQARRVEKISGPRVLRRLKAQHRDLDWERREIEAAGPEPDA